MTVLEAVVIGFIIGALTGIAVGYLEWRAHRNPPRQVVELKKK